MAVHGVIADYDDGPLGQEVSEEEAGHGAAQSQPGPGGAGEDPLVVGAVAGRERAEGAEQVGDGAAARGEHGGGHQQDEPLVGRLGEDRGENVQQRQGFVG